MQRPRAPAARFVHARVPAVLLVLASVRLAPVSVRLALVSAFVLALPLVLTAYIGHTSCIIGRWLTGNPVGPTVTGFPVTVVPLLEEAS